MNDLLERLLDEVQKEWGVGGLDSSTMYGEFAIEVAKRAVLAEREACANVAEEFEDDMGYGKAQKIADKIRMRSNA